MSILWNPPLNLTTPFSLMVSFRVMDQNDHLFLYLKDYFNKVIYMKDQNTSTPIHQGLFWSFSQLLCTLYFYLSKIRKVITIYRGIIKIMGWLFR